MITRNPYITELLSNVYPHRIPKIKKVPIAITTHQEIPLHESTNRKMAIKSYYLL